MMKRPIPSIFPRKGIFYYDFRVKGKRYRSSTKTSDETKAREIAEEEVSRVVRFALDDGVLPHALPASMLFDRYEGGKRGEGVKEGTLNNYKIYRERFLKKFGDVKLSDLNKYHIEGWRNDLMGEDNQAHGRSGKGLTRKTVAEHLRYLSAVYNYFELPNPVKKVKTPLKTHIEQQEELQYFTEDEARELLKASGKKRDIEWKTKKEGAWYLFYFWIRLLLFTGIRRNEAHNLRFKDIDFKKRIIQVRSKKTETRRPLNLSDEEGFAARAWIAIMKLSEYRLLELMTEEEKADYKIKNPSKGRSRFPLNEGKDKRGRDMFLIDHNILAPMFYKYADETLHNRSHAWLYKRLQKACVLAKIPKRPLHATRHHFATVILMNNIWSIEFLAKYLGHKNVSTTFEKYAHFVPDKPATAYYSIRD